MVLWRCLDQQMPLEEAQALWRQRALLRSNSAQETRTHTEVFFKTPGLGGFQRGGVTGHDDVFFLGGGEIWIFRQQKLEKDEVEGLEDKLCFLLSWFIDCHVDYFILKLISCGSFDFQVYDFLENVLCSQCKKRWWSHWVKTSCQIGWTWRLCLSEGDAR